MLFVCQIPEEPRDPVHGRHGVHAPQPAAPSGYVPRTMCPRSLDPFYILNYPYKIILLGRAVNRRFKQRKKHLQNVLRSSKANSK